MAKSVEMRNPATGVTKTGYYGFSWTSFFFGGLPALIRGDVAIGLGLIALGMLAGVFTVFIGWWLVAIVWAFIYNRIYTTRLIERGYKFADSADVNAAACDALSIGSQAVLSEEPFAAGLHRS